MPATAAVAVPQCSVDCGVFAKEKKHDREGLGPPKTHFDFSPLYNSVDER